MVNCSLAYYDGYYGCDNNSDWYVWGRWVLLGVVLLVVVLLYFTIACLTARKRRKAGREPYFGTGWVLGRTPPGHAPAEYTTSQPFSQNPVSNENNITVPPPAYETGRNGEDVELGQQKPAYA